MKISVIIPTYNEASNIRQALDFLQRTGTDHPVEIILVDGGSTDDTAAIATATGVNVMFSPKGRAIQMNHGATESRGDILYFVHADTQPPESWLPDLLNAIHKGAKMGCFRYRFDSKSWLLSINAWFTRFDFLFCQGGDKSFFISRNDFFALGAYDPYYSVMEEYDFIRRAGKKGYKIVVLPAECLVSARKYAHNSWLRVQIANLVVFNMWKLGIGSPDQWKRWYTRMLR